MTGERPDARNLDGTESLRAGGRGNPGAPGGGGPGGAPCYLGIDVGGTKTLGLLLAAGGAVLERRRVPTPQGAALSETIVTMVSALHEAADALGCRLRGVGIGAPGFVDSARGLILDASNLALRELALGPVVEDRCGLPTHLTHDVRAATRAEASMGAGVGLSHLAYLNVGTGIAAGFVLNGALYDGAGGRAGEIGHVVVRPDGPTCSCGKRGCLEAVASGRALAAQAEDLARERPESILAAMARRGGDGADGAPVSGARLLAQAAEAGDPSARAHIAEAATYLGQVVAWLVDTLALERVVVGGGVAKMGGVLLEPLREAADRALLDANRDPGLIVPSALGDDAGAVGAALAARHRFEAAGHEAAGHEADLQAESERRSTSRVADARAARQGDADGGAPQGQEVP